MNAMPRRHRVRRVAKWTALCATVLILAAWALSTIRVVDWRGERHSLTSAFGTIFVVWIEGDATAIETYKFIWLGWGFWPAASWGVCFRQWGLVWPESHWFPLRDSGGSVISHQLRVPYWLPFVGMALLSRTLFYLDRKRPPTGHCRRCG